MLELLAHLTALLAEALAYLPQSAIDALNGYFGSK